MRKYWYLQWKKFNVNAVRKMKGWNSLPHFQRGAWCLLFLICICVFTGADSLELSRQPQCVCGAGGLRWVALGGHIEPWGLWRTMCLKGMGARCPRGRIMLKCWVLGWEESAGTRTHPAGAICTQLQALWKPAEGCLAAAGSLWLASSCLLNTAYGVASCREHSWFKALFPSKRKVLS